MPWQRWGGFEKSLRAWGLARLESHERVRTATDWARSAQALKGLERDRANLRQTGRRAAKNPGSHA